MYSNLGEIRGDHPQVKLLANICQLGWVREVLEIGTLDGTGSTLTMLTAMRSRPDFDAIRFTSIEANQQANALANANLAPLPPNVSLLYGSLIHSDTPMLLLGLTDEERVWLNDDSMKRFQAPNLIGQLPKQLDLTVLDGGEFSTVGDYLVLRMRTTVLFLHDIEKRKNRYTVQLAREDGFVEIFNDGNASVLFHPQRAGSHCVSLLQLLGKEN